jgi:hypothetical protein
MAHHAPRTLRSLAVASLATLVAVETCQAQQKIYAPAAPRPMSRAARPAPGYDPNVRWVQAPADEAPALPAPSLPATSAPVAPYELPAAENRLGGGEATTEEGAAEAPPERDESKLLTNFLGREDAKVKIYGWIQNSFTANPAYPSNHLNFGVTPNFKSNAWLGNQYYLILEKPVEQNDEFNLGFRLDNLFGNDFSFNKMYGLFDNAFVPGRFGYDPAQFFVEAHIPIAGKSIDVKAGRWYTLAGYEVVPATGRPLLSVPYMFNFGQPFTHTGVLTNFHLTDKISIYNGAINGWDRWFNEDYRWGYIGGLTWTFNEDKTNLAITTVQGPNQFPTNVPTRINIIPTGTGPGNIGPGTNPAYAKNNRSLFTYVLSHKWNDKLTQVMEFDHGFEAKIPGLKPPAGPNSGKQSASWYGFGNWFLYSFNEKLTGVWRSEIWRDQNGARTGFAGTYNEMTLGMIYKPQPWLWIRPEARYDWSPNNPVYNGGVSTSQFTYGLDVIVTF